MWKHPPVKFGLFYIFFLLLAIVWLGIAIYFGYRFQGKEKQKKRDLILTITGLNLVAMDIGKIIFDFARHSADWSLVPLQLCSTALLVLPLPYFLKEGKFKDCINGYLAFIRTTAGICYFVNPTTLFEQPYIISCIHSGIYHVLIIASGTFLFFSNERYSKKGVICFLRSVPLFVFFTLLAVGGNSIALHLDPHTKIDYFFLNPKGPATIPVLDTLVRPRIPFVGYYFVYLGCRLICNFVPFLVFSLINLAVKKVKNQRTERVKEA